MSRGRGRRRYHYRKTGNMWRTTWLLSALAAAAVIYGIVEWRAGRGQETDGAQVSIEAPSSGAGGESGRSDTAGQGPSRSQEDEEALQGFSIQVVDVNDSDTVEIPVQWLRGTDDGTIRAALEERVSRIADKWNRNPVDSQMESFDKETGTYQYSDEVYGRVLDEGRLAEDLFRAVKEKDRETQIQAEFISVPPGRTKAQAKEQYKVIGTFTTTTTSNKNRNQNIRLAADAIDGMVLKPGEEFSFNEATGNRTSEKGYQPAGAYRNGVLIEEPGGGVCQVSTTLYHAIIKSGFKTTERNFHSFAPSYIEKGQDAMVSFDGYAGPDLRFVNTGSAAVGLRASFADNQLKLSIVGLPMLEDGKTVTMRSEKVRELDPPEPVYEENPELAYGEEKVIEQAQPGSVWKTYRQVKQNGELVEETLLHSSTYKAKPAKIQRNSAAQPTEPVAVPDGTGQVTTEQGGTGQVTTELDGTGQTLPGQDGTGQTTPEQGGAGQNSQPVAGPTGSDQSIIIQSMPGQDVPSLDLSEGE